MKILVSCVPFDAGKSGISVYMLKLLQALREEGHDLTVLAEPGGAGFFPGFRVVEMPGWTRRPVLSMLHHLLILPFQLRKFQCDGCIVAAGNRRAFAFYPVKTIMTIHDLAQYHVENKYDRFRMAYLKHILPFFVRLSPLLAAISRSTLDDMVRFWHVPPEKIRLVYNGLSLPDNQRCGWTAANGLTPGKYLLYISRIHHPGKNHISLIRAFEQLPDALRKEYTLVLAGADWDGAEAVHAYAEQSPARDAIFFSGFLPTEDLVEAYRNAGVYVFASLFEGFGLSLIEAMHYQVPCCCSNNSSLGEIGQGAALLFDPENPQEIAECLQKILTDPATRTELIRAGSARAKEFSWQKHAQTLVEALK